MHMQSQRELIGLPACGQLQFKRSLGVCLGKAFVGHPGAMPPVLSRQKLIEANIQQSPKEDH
jgi:hypothetical protein